MPQLSWYKREEDLTRAPLAPYRLLQPIAGLSYGDQNSPNMLIEGDNLDALKALMPYYAGQIKCIYIDPPYNTRSAFEHYDDNLEHSQWLSMMYPRLRLLKDLLSEDGSFWVSIDEDEYAYLKVLCDEIFGRHRFITTNVWQKRYAPDSRTAISDAHEYILCYAMNPRKFKEDRNLLPLTDAQTKQFKNPDKDPRGPWKARDFTAPGYRPNQMYEITLPSGRVVTPPGGRCWRVTKEGFERFSAEGKMYYGPKGDGAPAVKRFLSEMPGMVPWTWWAHTDAGHSQEGKKESQCLFGDDSAFSTPKPERLIQRVLQIATKPDDLVLDSFLGSGTTSAVAHKMGRRWIGIEMGEHARTYCYTRLKRVVDGEKGGISNAVDWGGGGGFRFFKLGPPVFDESGRIHEDISFEHLAAHIWFSETGTARSGNALKEAFLGVQNGIGYYLLYNGILGDTNKSGGNVLTHRVFRSLPKFDGPKVIYGEACSMTEEQLDELDVTFKQTPYDIKA